MHSWEVFAKSANVPRMTGPRVIMKPYDKTLRPQEGPHEKERMRLVHQLTSIGTRF